MVAGASTFDVINPATEQRVAACPRADEEQLNQAVAAAKAAFPAWSARPITERRKLILELADALAEHTEELAQLLTQEQGKPLMAARYEIGGAIGIARVLAGLDLPLKVLKDDANGLIVQQRTPLGVVATITPWNFPIILLMTKLTPALLAGNTVIAKPAPTAPLTTLRLGELCADGQRRDHREAPDAGARWKRRGDRARRRRPEDRGTESLSRRDGQLRLGLSRGEARLRA
jgi:acyl-CoA reductase-like NAD-dependent aldehyde dehydrogenase